MDASEFGSIRMYSNVTDLKTHEQEAYLRYLISRMENPDCPHQQLTAKAFRAILGCLEIDGKHHDAEAGND